MLTALFAVVTAITLIAGIEHWDRRKHRQRLRERRTKGVRHG